MGVDFGIEFDESRFRIYSEFQILPGVSIVGLSAGPVFEVSYDGNLGIGLQASAWAAIAVGADIRLRWLIPKTLVVAPGLFLKWPFFPGD